MKYYAGIGSRFAPDDILELCFNIGKILAENEYVLRSGHADGCDISFEKGSDAVDGKKQIFLPWKNFNNSASKYYFKNNLIPENIKEITLNNYPNWYLATIPVKFLHARNTQQILGADLLEHVDFVVAYTNRSEFIIGGTMYGIQLAKKYGIKVFNLYLEEEKDAFFAFMNKEFDIKF